MNRLSWKAVALAALAGVGGLIGTAQSKPWWLRGVESNESDFLAPDVAFRVGSMLDGNRVRVRWNIADGYYLYRHKMEITAESPDLSLGAPSFPPGTQKTDPYLGTQEIFTQEVEATAAFTRSDAGAHPLEIKVTYQGCATAGLCYPPITKVLFPAGSGAARAASVAPPMESHRWESVGILGGGAAFLLAGWVLRRDRRLKMPAL